jgi:hypothetical protein
MLNIYTLRLREPRLRHTPYNDRLYLVIISMAAFPGMPSLATEGDSKVISTGDVLTGAVRTAYE